MDDPNKITVDPSAVQSVLASAVRIVILLTGGVTTLLGLLRRADLEGLYAYIQSTDGLTFIGAAITAGTASWALYTRWRSHDDKVRAADPADPAYLALKR